MSQGSKYQIDEKESKIILKNERIEVGILKPGEIYNRPRFDWNGFISDVILDGQHKFCRSHYDGSHEEIAGRGLCNEFGMVIPLGKDKGADYFPKIGIGAIPMVEDERSVVFPIDEMKLYPKSYTVEDHRVVFKVEAVEYNGYAMALTKSVAIKGNELTIDYSLKNTGLKAIDTEEYCHNFVLVDDYPVGPDYKVTTSFRLPINFEDDDLSKILTKTETGYTWKEKPSDVYFFRTEVETDTNDYSWQMIHQPSGVGIKESGDFTPYLFATWGLEEVVSPEVFIRIELEPGETKSWQRRYEFID